MPSRRRDREVFSCTPGARVVTDLDGRLRGIIGILPEAKPIEICFNGVARRVTVRPNQIVPLAAQ